MKKLTLIFHRVGIYDISVRLKGLSFKSAPNCRDLLRSDFRTGLWLSLSNWDIDGHTAQAKRQYLIDISVEIYDGIQFTGIKLEGFSTSKFTGEEIFNEVINKTS